MISGFFEKREYFWIWRIWTQGVVSYNPFYPDMQNHIFFVFHFFNNESAFQLTSFKTAWKLPISWLFWKPELPDQNWRPTRLPRTTTEAALRRSWSTRCTSEDLTTARWRISAAPSTMTWQKCHGRRKCERGELKIKKRFH